MILIKNFSENKIFKHFDSLQNIEKLSKFTNILQIKFSRNLNQSF